jgi:hypothetical protein
MQQQHLPYDVITGALDHSASPGQRAANVVVKAAAPAAYARNDGYGALGGLDQAVGGARQAPGSLPAAAGAPRAPPSAAARAAYADQQQQQPPPQQQQQQTMAGAAVVGHNQQHAAQQAAQQYAETGPISPGQALKRYSEYLTDYEQSEVLHYPQVRQTGASGGAGRGRQGVCMRSPRNRDTMRGAARHEYR